MNPYQRVVKKGCAGQAHQHSRKRTYRIHKKGKLRESIGILDKRKKLSVSLLNVDGLSELSLLSVENALAKKSPDVCICLETKRRKEELGQDISLDGYEVTERRRSDGAGDKAGGGIAMYTKKTPGLTFKEHMPNIDNPAHAFVNNERLWMKVHSLRQKTALCAVYMGFQAPDDRHGDWNNIIYQVLQSEIRDLRKAGYRVILKGDFNGHVGDTITKGVVGNHPDINRNGARFIDFLKSINACHLNGECRVKGDWSTRISRGLWTRQRGGISSVLDYGVILAEHVNTVKSFVIDDQGEFPTGSDHNWTFLEVEDCVVSKRRVPCNKSIKKQVWNFGENHDWSKFTESVEAMVGATDFESMDMDQLAKKAAEILLSSGNENIGFRDPKQKRSRKYTSLPRDVVNAIELRTAFETNWKTKSSALASTPVSERSGDGVASVAEAERVMSEQNIIVQSLLSSRRHIKRDQVLKNCQGNSAQAAKCFWSYVSPCDKKSSDIDCVFSPSENTLVVENEAIKLEVEKHLVKVFQGSFEPIVPEPAEKEVDDEHSYAGVDHSDPCHDHSYAETASPTFPSSDGSGQIETDPQGWLEKKFSVGEIKKNVKALKNSKAKGLDGIPNEFVKNAGPRFHVLLTSLFNKIKESGRFPEGWNKGRICLVHKKGEREHLGNYRPLTVIISLSGLYSRVLNDRLALVVETHRLLGEIQNGFRKGRMGADNAFILDTIFWKARSQKQKVNIAFFDVTKAYDTVDRGILWHRMSALGFGGQFLDTIKSIYSGDSVQCVVNGLTTRPVYLRRGLRQGCSLSPMLFNLYVSSLANDIVSSSEGFLVGHRCVSALFFADDLAVCARSREGLLRLMTLVKTHADRLRFEINTTKDKSEVLAQEGVAGES